MSPKNPQMDLYRLLRTPDRQESFNLKNLYRRVQNLLEQVRKMEQSSQVRLDHTLHSKDAISVVSESLAHLGSYHRKPALVRRGDRVFDIDRNLLLYYQNRLAGFDIPRREQKP